MRLFDFILKNLDSLLDEWESFARSIQPPEGDMEVSELRDHAEEMLRAIAADMQTPQTLWERSDKSKGKKPREANHTAAETHAAERLASGFSIHLLAAEYRALRASVLDHWLWEHESLQAEEVGDLMRFNEAIDQSLAQAISRYSEIVQKEQHVFLSILGHDLRAPLHSISLGTQYLMHAEEDKGGSVAPAGIQMLNSVNRMSRMIDNLLNFTQTRMNGEIPIVPTETNLSAVAEQAVAEFCLSNPDCEVRNEIKGDCVGRWDGVRIAQIYQNLISNALQYGERGKPVIVTTEGDAAEVVIRVHNEGEPIPEQEQERLFDLFHRLTLLAEEEIPNRNLGLGLYIVREIVSAHDGSITVTSTQAEGTDFTVRLPKEPGARRSTGSHKPRAVHVTHLPGKPDNPRLH